MVDTDPPCAQILIVTLLGVAESGGTLNPPFGRFANSTEKYRLYSPLRILPTQTLNSKL
jgi:hypothetical protein